MNKILLVIAGLLGMGAAIEKEHLDFRPEISTGITNVVLGGEDDIPVVPPVDNNDCPCNKNTGIILKEMVIKPNVHVIMVNVDV